MLKVNNLFLRYTREFYALYNINIDIADNEKVAFVGHDESGKTSLIRIFAKLEKMTKGEVFIKEIPLEKLNYKTDISAGYVPACPVFLEKKSVYENFKYILKGWGYSDSEMEAKINETIIEYSLEKIKDTKLKDLSLEEKYVLSLIRLTFRELEFLMVDNIFGRWELMQDIQNGGQQSFWDEDIDNGIIDESEIELKVMEHLSRFTIFTRMNPIMADFYCTHGVICPSKTVKEIYKKLEKSKKLEVRRTPSTTATGRASTFFADEKKQITELRWRG